MARTLLELAAITAIRSPADPGCEERVAYPVRRLAQRLKRNPRTIRFDHGRGMRKLRREPPEPRDGHSISALIAGAIRRTGVRRIRSLLGRTVGSEPIQV